MEIKPSKLNAYVGEKIIFTTDVNENLNWNFGDNTTKSGNEVTHAFDSKGNYFVKAGSETVCADSIEIIVGPKIIIATVVPEISYPSGYIFAGEEVTFTNKTKGANNWSWNVVGTRQTSQDKSFTTTFTAPGKYRLALSVNGDLISGVDTFIIKVRLKPPPPPPWKEVKVPCSELRDMSYEEFKIAFIGACNGIAKPDDDEANNSGSDKMLELAAEMCKGFNTTIKLVGEDHTITLNSFIKSLQNGEYRRVESINITSSPKCCVTSINVSAIPK